MSCTNRLLQLRRERVTDIALTSLTESEESLRSSEMKNSIGTGSVGFVSIAAADFENPATALESARPRIIFFAEVEGLDITVVDNLSAEELGEFNRLSDAHLRGYIGLMRDSFLRGLGQLAPGDGTPVSCATCGPVPLRRSIAAALPFSDGWPRAAGCPWCHVNNPTKKSFEFAGSLRPNHVSGPPACSGMGLEISSARVACDRSPSKNISHAKFTKKVHHERTKTTTDAPSVAGNKTAKDNPVKRCACAPDWFSSRTKADLEAHSRSSSERTSASTR